MTETLKLLTSATITEISGVGMYSASFFATTSRSWSAVRPAAWMSFRRAIEILPSGLTVTIRLIASFFHTEIWRTSSGPMRYSVGARNWVGQGDPYQKRVVEDDHPLDQILQLSDVSGERVARESFHHRRSDGEPVAPVELRVPLDEVVGQ